MIINLPIMSTQKIKFICRIFKFKFKLVIKKSFSQWFFDESLWYLAQFVFDVDDVYVFWDKSSFATNILRGGGKRIGGWRFVFLLIFFSNFTNND